MGYVDYGMFGLKGEGMFTKSFYFGSQLGSDQGEGEYVYSRMTKLFDEIRYKMKDKGFKAHYLKYRVVDNTKDFNPRYLIQYKGGVTYRTLFPTAKRHEKNKDEASSILEIIRKADIYNYEVEKMRKED